MIDRSSNGIVMRPTVLPTICSACGKKVYRANPLNIAHRHKWFAFDAKPSREGIVRLFGNPLICTQAVVGDDPPFYQIHKCWRKVRK